MPSAIKIAIISCFSIPKSILKSKEFKDEFFGKVLVLLKDAFGENNILSGKAREASREQEAVFRRSQGMQLMTRRLEM